MKLVLAESGYDALLRELSRWDGFVSSMLLGTETIRACGRHGETYSSLAREWLSGPALVPVSDKTLDIAAYLDPSKLRSLDAIHLATAVSVRSEIGAFVAYDDRLGQAAELYGFEVARPEYAEGF